MGLDDDRLNYLKSIDESIDRLEEQLAQRRKEIEVIGEQMANADESHRDALKERLKLRNEELNASKQQLKAAREAREEEDARLNSHTKYASKLREVVDNSSISAQLTSEMAAKFSLLADKGDQLASAAGESAENIKAAADANKVLSEIESVRSSLIKATQAGDISEVARQNEKLSSLNQQLNLVISSSDFNDQQRAILSEMLGIQAQMTLETKHLAGLTEGQLAQYKKLIGEAEEWKTKFKAIKDMAATMLKNPMTMLGGLVIGAGYLMDKIAATNKLLGVSFVDMNGMATSAGILSFLFDDAAETARDLAHHLGDSNKVTLSMQASTNMIASNLGISGTEAAELSAQFGHLRGQTHDQAMDMMASARATALARGVVPNDLMKDLAQNTEMFSLYAKGGGENIIAAGIAARKLGVDMKTLNTMAESLMDFESSIEKELEASAMLGRDLNFQRARELIYTGDLEAAQKEIISQLGTKAQFDKMDLYQKKAAADALGIQVSELEKIYKGQENLAGASGIVADKFSWLAESSRYIANEWGGGIIKGIGGAVIAMGGLGREVAEIRDRTKDAVGLWDKLKGFLGFTPATQATGAFGGPAADVTQTVTEKIQEEVTDKGVSTVSDSISEKLEEKGTEKVEGLVDDKLESITSPEGVEKAAEGVGGEKGIGDKLTDLAKGLKEMGNGKVLFGAFNLIPTGIGFLALTPGLPSLFALSKINLSKLGDGLMNLAIGLGFMSGGKISAGAGNLILAGIGFLLMTPGIIGMFLFTKIGGPTLQMNLQSLGTGLGFMAGGKVASGAGNLILAGLGFLIMTPGIVGMFLFTKIGGPSLQMNLQSLGTGLGFMAGGKVALGALNLILAGVGFAALTLGAIGMAAVALLGIPASIGLTALSTAFNTMNPASMLMGALSIAALGIALIPFAYSMSLMSGVDIGSILSVAAGLIIFGAAAVGLGFIAPLVLAGAVAIAGLGLALIPFSSAMANLGGANLESSINLAKSILPLALSVAAVGFLSPAILVGAAVLQILSLGLISFSNSIAGLGGVNIETANSLAKSILPLSLSVAAVGALFLPILLGSATLYALSSGLATYSNSMAGLGGVNIETANSLAKSILPLAESIASVGILFAPVLIGSATLQALSSGLATYSNSMTGLAGVDMATAMAIADSIYPLGLAVASIGVLSPAIIAGSYVLDLLSGSLKTLSSAVSLMGNIDIANKISELSTINFMPIYGLATALGDLSKSLLGLAISGILALPVLSGLSNLGVGFNLAGESGKGRKNTSNEELLSEIKGLRADLNGGKVAVYMDGQRVTAAVAAANARSPLTIK